MTTTLNNAALELIASFSKANKVSKTKLTEFAEQLINTVEVAPVKVAGVRGKKASETVMALRQMMQQKKDEVINMTAKEVSEHFGADLIEANNTLRYLEKTGLFMRAGLKDKAPGVRGKREVIWSGV